MRGRGHEDRAQFEKTYAEHSYKKFKTGKELIRHGIKYQDIATDDETESTKDSAECQSENGEIMVCGTF